MGAARSLKLLWSGVGPWLEREAKWAAVTAAGFGVPEFEEWAAASALEPLGGVISTDYRHRGDSHVLDRDRLLEVIGCDSSVLEDDLAFDDHGSLVVPWPVTLRLSQRAAPSFAEELLVDVKREEEKAQREAIHGRHFRYRRGEDWFTSPEDCARLDEEEWKPARDLIRDWCGDEGRVRYDEWVALRAEVRRLLRLLEEAAMALADAGRPGEAKRLEDEIGIPVEVLRRRPRDQNPQSLTWNRLAAAASAGRPRRGGRR